MKKVTFILFLCVSVIHQTFTQEVPERPNILWIVCEDISPDLTVYGDSTARTPNLDAFAAQSLVYTNAFSTAGVCAPSRSSIITGMHPFRIGTMHMRTGKDVFGWGKREYAERENFTDLNGDSLRQYSVVLPPEVKCFPEYLRAAGYFCTNNAKTDYQFAAPLTAWDENGNHAHWRHRKVGQAFFSVFNIGLTHESRLWLHEDKPLTVDPTRVEVPPYLPDTKQSRQTIARHYSNIELMDAAAGKILQQLKDDGLYEQTIIFFYSDHGGPLPREKREVYDSGLRVPLFVKPAGATIMQGYDHRLVSFVDFAPTLLSLAGVSIPDYMEGQVFLGSEAGTERAFIYGGSDRLDECTDRIRVVRDKQHLYVNNDFPSQPGYEDLGYRKNIPMMPEMLALRDEGLLGAQQMQWFRDKSPEELYDVVNDPYTIHNLAGNPEYREVLGRMREEYLRWIQTGPDFGRIPEAKWIDLQWPDGRQPVTASPEMTVKESQVILSCGTEGASIAWLMTDDPAFTFDFDAGWKLYTGPFKPEGGRYIYAVGERAGYRISEMVRGEIFD